MDKEFEIIKKYFAPLANNQESLNLQNDAAFFKDTPRNKAALGGIVPHQWPKD